MILNPASSWTDVQRAAHNDPVLAAMLEWVHRNVPREQALIAAVLFFSKERNEYLARETERLANAPPAPARTMEIQGQTYQLRSMAVEVDQWKARGQVDKVAVGDTLRTLMGAEAAGPYLTHLERAIDARDK